MRHYIACVHAKTIFFVVVIDCYSRMNIQRLWKVKGRCPKLQCHCDIVKKVTFVI